MILQNIGFPGLFDVLSSRPVLNKVSESNHPAFSFWLKQLIQTVDHWFMCLYRTRQDWWVEWCQVAWTRIKIWGKYDNVNKSNEIKNSATKIWQTKVTK